MTSAAWPVVPLGELLERRLPSVTVDPTRKYQFAGVYCFGRGVFRSQERLGSEFSYRSLTQLRAGDFVYPKLMAWEGAFGVVPDACDSCYVSPEFPVFHIRPDRLLSQFLGYYFRIPAVWETTAEGSIGTNVRRRRLHPDDLLRKVIPLPPLSDQRRIVARVEQIAAKVTEASDLYSAIAAESDRLLSAAFAKIVASAPREPLGAVAPLTRRPVGVDVAASYPQVSARSFGRGTFHRPPLLGNEVTWEKPYLVKSGDVLISNIKAWEGAIAVAREDDDGRVASHRYLTCVPLPGVANARFVCFYLLSPEGLHWIGSASPGSADRNRTLRTTALSEIPVPMPPFQQQCWFDRLFQRVEASKRERARSSNALAALMPAILDRAFKGEL